MRYQKLKDMAAVFVIVFLLPYVVSVVLFGFPEKDSHKEKNVGQTVCIAYENRQEIISLEQYLIGVLAAQVPVDYSMEVLKAHGVLARTYYEIHEKDLEVIEQENSTQNFLSKEQMKALWKDKFEANYKKLEQAVIDTSGLCMYYQDKLAEPYFHSASVGTTRNGKEVLGSQESAYLQSVQCEKDLQMDNYVTIKTFTREELEGILTQLEKETDTGVTGQSIEVKLQSPKEMFKIKEKDSAGYVTAIEVDGHWMHGETFRHLMQLPSAAFQVEQWETGVRFVCKGLGHGLGMSLYTANELAMDGKDYEEILNYFFANIVIQ